jgi:hypothetical protein
VRSNAGPFWRFAEADAESPTRIGSDDPFVDSLTDDHGEQDEDILRTPVRQIGAKHLVDPDLDCDSLDITQSGVGPAGQDVVTDVGVVGRLGDVGDVVGVAPSADPSFNTGPGQPGIGEPVSSLIGLDIRGTVVGLVLGGVSVLGVDGCVVEALVPRPCS